MQSNFIEITFRHGCSPVSLLHIFRTPFTKKLRTPLDGCFWLSYLVVRVIGDSLLFLSILEKNQKYLFTNLFTSILPMKLFLRNNIAFTMCAVEESISSRYVI